MKHAERFLYLSSLSLCAYAYSVKDSDPIITEIEPSVEVLSPSVFPVFNIGDSTTLDSAASLADNIASHRGVNKLQYFVSFDKGGVASTSVRDAVKAVKTDTATTAYTQHANKSIDSLCRTNDVFKRNYEHYFQSNEQLLKQFCLYIKTQSYNLGDDTRTVIVVMFNRLDHNKCDWSTYWNTPSINNSRSIKRLKSGSLKQTFLSKNVKESEYKTDMVLYAQVMSTLGGSNPTAVPPNVLFFESHDQCPNRGVFLRKNIWRTYTHRFYKSKNAIVETESRFYFSANN